MSPFLSGGRSRRRAIKSAEPARDIPMAVKDPKLVAKRRHQIVDATVQLFINKGFHKTTTREIA
ncbi:hypothetical protein DFAR_750017 [Desulfarculales bacterium]